MMMLMVAGAVIAALTGGGSPNYIVKWNTTEAVMDSKMYEDTAGETLNMIYETVNITNSDSHTILILDNEAGISDVSLEMRNNGNLAWTICMDDSYSDELKFIRAGSSCSSTDLMSLTGDGLEMGNARLYFDRSSTWVGTTPSARYNNQFTIRNLIITSVSTISHNINGQIIFVICNDAVTTLVDAAPLGNLQLSGDFDCAVGDSISLIYNDVIGKWVEVSRSDNS